MDTASSDVPTALVADEAKTDLAENNGDIVDPSWLIWYGPLAWKVTQVYKQRKDKQKAVAAEQAAINEIQNSQVAQWVAEEKARKQQAEAAKDSSS
jgi:hypothetical protein